MRRLALVGNWKMHTTPSQARELARELRERLEGVKEVDIAVCPPATSLAAVADALAGSNIAWGAQNAHWAEAGAFTGEISVSALRELGCTYVIVGHSERRHIFGESDEMVAKRLVGVTASGLVPILCVGETEAERELGQTEKVLTRQLERAFERIEEPPAMVAYEPVWAIGTGKRAEIGDMEMAHRFIRERLAARFGSKAQGVRILYGGSLKPANVAELASSEEFDGGLVGGASLSASSFAELIARAIERRNH
ncbi:triose-phosphate isomerase [candidate division TA06 bacterium B3_TA06]|uniref:Triosephosphate isomerase n=1 Tax=candidate division TA06 bacterium B3_TA06 TaxID=2012487 RepID=A0A532VB20_UNCT6|nr:MAG: triose-phosphate isomerase [candidate division TA06 bacterium B3_TA06]